MHREILSKGQLALLPLIKLFSKEFYLAGGTAVALHIGHRRSIDFDLFTDKNIIRIKSRQAKRSGNSPYFIEALKLHSEKYLEEDQFAFYLSQKRSDAPTAFIDNVTHDISPIFEILSEPFDELEMLQ
jgi:hypothetical protein